MNFNGLDFLTLNNFNLNIIFSYYYLLTFWTTNKKFIIILATKFWVLNLPDDKSSLNKIISKHKS